MTKKRCLLIVIIIIAVLLCVFCFNHRMPDYDNLVKKEEVITQQYPPEKVDKLTQKMEQKEMRYAELRRMFRLECVRKTDQGYYAVLQLTDGSNAFIFLDDRLIVSRVAVYDRFRSKEEFERMLSEKPDATWEDVLLFDPNEYSVPYSVVTEEAHIVQEGVIVVRYQREERYPVDQIYFYSNSEVAAAELGEHPIYTIKMRVPYVLEIDRVNDHFRLAY